MRKSGVLLAGLMVLLVGTAASSGGGAAAHWVIIDLGPGAAADINESGQVVGGGAWIWQNGKKTQLGTLGGRRSSVVAINDRGRAGSFIWQNGKRTNLPALSPRSWWVSPTELNERDQIVGNSTTARGKGRAVLWTIERGL
jgi:uncharacterized membrane protein